MNELMKKAEQEMIRLKGYFPYRVVWAAINEETGEVITGASATRRHVNAYMRRGWTGFTL